MAEDDKAVRRWDQNETEHDAWTKHRRNPVTWEGTFGVDADGTMTEDGWRKFVDDLRASGFRIARLEE